MTDRTTTIGILSHNRSWQLAQCLASIREFTKFTDYKILILDTDSELNHREHARQFEGENCRMIEAGIFYSCLEGRRKLLDYVDTPYIAYVDDDLKVGDQWLTSMHRALVRYDAVASTGNIIQEGDRITSGGRTIEPVDGKLCVRELPANHEGTVPLCLGGATLYETDVLRQTEYRPEYSAGFEDWDQTLQISQDQKRPIATCRATVFHNHQVESLQYAVDRWRWHDLLDGAIAIWRRWHIRSAIDNSLRQLLASQITISDEQYEAVREALT